MSARLLGILTCAAVLAACDPIWTLRVRVVAPPGAFEVAGVFPQGVFVSLNDPFIDADTPRSLVAVVCEPLTETALFKSKITAVGWHGHRGHTWAWAEPLPEGASGEPCGSRPNFVAVDRFPASEFAWRASSVMFEHEDAEDTVTLELAPP
jgi:hypothetical protein